MSVDTTNLFTCLQCGNTFYMTDTEMEWYTARGMHIPKRCPVCREQNRVAGRTTRHIVTPEIQATLQRDVSTEPSPAPLVFYGRVVNSATKVHGNAKYHIFNDKGKSLCNSYDTADGILLANVMLTSPDDELLCKHCNTKLHKN